MFINHQMTNTRRKVVFKQFNVFFQVGIKIIREFLTSDIQVKGTESDHPFILDEVVSDIKEELSKLKEELANMIRIFGKQLSQIGYSSFFTALQLIRYT